MALKVLKDHTNRRIGRVTVLGKAPNGPVRVIRPGEEHVPKLAWLCRCDCGTLWPVPHARISAHAPASCRACADAAPRRSTPILRSREHVKKAHPAYGSWYAMLRRCTDPKHENYHNYGARGINVASEWLDFDQFVRDMGPKPTSAHTIDRIDNAQGYSKHNCRWATPKEQASNRRKRSP